MQLDAEKIIAKLQQKIAEQAGQIATLEVIIETLQDNKEKEASDG